MTDNTLTVIEIPNGDDFDGVWSQAEADEVSDAVDVLRKWGGREIVFEKWNDWCWAHDKEPNCTGGTCIFQGYRGDCDIRPMYELVEVERG